MVLFRVPHFGHAAPALGTKPHPKKHTREEHIQNRGISDYHRPRGERFFCGIEQINAIIFASVVQRVVSRTVNIDLRENTTRIFCILCQTNQFTLRDILIEQCLAVASNDAASVCNRDNAVIYKRVSGKKRANRQLRPLHRSRLLSHVAQNQAGFVQSGNHRVIVAITVVMKKAFRIHFAGATGNRSG